MIVYIETNLIMGAATGQDPDVERLLQIPNAQLRKALPTVCVMEAWAAFEKLTKNYRQFGEQLDSQVNELRRDQAYAQSLTSSLEQLRLSMDKRLNDVEDRLFRTLFKLAGIREEDRSTAAELIALSPEAMVGSGFHIMKQPTDNLILNVITDHARQNPDEEKVLLTANSRDFNTPDIRNLLTGAGISKFFWDTTTFLRWFESRR